MTLQSVFSSQFLHAAHSVATPHVLSLGDVRLITFSCIKVLPARYMLQAAIDRGILTPGGTVIETSSGTFALGLSLVCNALDLKTIIICDPAIDTRLARRLVDLGCTIEMIHDCDCDGGYQGARLRKLREFRRIQKDAYWPNQYDNPDNPASYRPIADALVESFGPKIALVVTVGSGGTSGGLGRRLREFDPSTPIIAVDTFDSVLFGQRDGPRLLRGLGNSIVPGNVDHSIFDEVHFVDAASAFKSTRELHRKHGAFVGPTTGAAWLVAEWVAHRYPDRLVVAIGPDDGHRYLDTVYDDAWLSKNAPLQKLPEEPLDASILTACTPPWSRFEWKRRNRDDVLRTGV